jgi:type I restriction enzyme, S subunit
MSNGQRTEMPKDWSSHRLDAVAECITGSTPPSYIRGAWGDGIPFITPGDIDQHGSLLPAARHVSQLGRKYVRELPVGAVLMTCIGIIGKVASTKSITATNQQINAAIPGQEILTSYLRAALQSEVSQANALAGIQVMPILNLAKFKSLCLAVPPLAEQRTIAEILDTVDEAIRSTERLIAKLEQAKQGLLHDLLTRGIDDSREWRHRSLDSCVDAARPITYGIVQAGPDVPGGIPYIRTVDLGRDRLSVGSLLRTSQAIATEYKRSAIKVGDVICGIRATVGRFQTVPDELDGANISRGIARLTPANDVSGEFLCIALNSTQGNETITRALKGSTFLELTLRQLGALEILLPPLGEQLEIVRRVTQFDHRISTEGALLRKLRVLKLGLMDDLLTGRVRVSAGEGALA